MNLDLDNLAIFVAITDAGSFTAAARNLGLPKSTVSRRLSDYETSLGITLFNRSTRSLSLTEEGAHVYASAKIAIDSALELSRSLHDRSATPSGTIRLTATASTGHHLLSLPIKAFLNKYPDVKIEIHLSDKRENIIEKGLDLAIRLGPLESSELMYRHLTEVNLVVVGSPEFIRQNGIPKHPSDLMTMECLVVEQKLGIWLFDDDLQIPVHWKLAPGSMLLSKTMALQGQGFAQLPDFVVADDLDNGQLQQVLADFTSPPVIASIVAPRQKYRSLAVRRLIDHLVDWYRKDSRDPALQN